MIELDLILPCYNPPDNWDKTVIYFFKRLQLILIDVQVNLIIIDDGSERNFDEIHLSTIKQIVKKITLLHNNENKGKGFTLREALKRSEAPYIIYTDCDFPFGVECIQAVLEELKNGKDVVAGIRGNGYLQRLPTYRLILSIGSKLLNRYILRLTIFDKQAGIKGFNKKGKQIFLSTNINGFLFDTEFILKSEKETSIKVGRVNVEPREGITFSNMRMKIVKNEFRNFLRLT